MEILVDIRHVKCAEMPLEALNKLVDDDQESLAMDDDQDSPATMVSENDHHERASSAGQVSVYSHSQPDPAVGLLPAHHQHQGDGQVQAKGVPSRLHGLRSW